MANDRSERLAALARVLERLDDTSEESNSADVMPQVSERGSGRAARSTSPSPPLERGLTTNPFRGRDRYPFEPDRPPFAPPPSGVTEFLNTQFDRALR